ncbi:type II toxin-antitoxin system HipA family toxin [Bifidobacterium sp. SO4]|uniref:type II toxin-antitoxin system HipA family toxin n=1 Tax=Bifidobacterium sp. SO4 TaxID=2809030 RepID=UPI001BDD7E84|nr:type II toxin-antitoxin system HipA family toxin [Bifidobacterium sp. SO4]MBT1171651.1 type II toxin-antitoxin system HipA family toxin [Bifidobacterium sp. SO4]
MSDDVLYAFLGETPVGVFLKDPNGVVHFRYNDEYRWTVDPTPISLSMPLIQNEHIGKAPENFLEALVPESPQAREEAARLHHARSTVAFDLLQSIGFDATGALRLSTTPQLPVENDSLFPISDAEIATRLRTAAPTGLQPATATEHWSVAGQQGKIALRLHHGSWYVTNGIARTTHIIKPGITTLPLQAFDEHLTMRIAAALGLHVANTEFRLFDGVPAIISERYDRRIADDGRVQALHQEDFTQALGLPASLKYEEHNGPTSEAYAAMLRTHGLPGQAESNIRAFIDGILVSYLLGATDSHAKNYSLLLDGESVRLAPLYDLASIFPYLGHGRLAASVTLAMNIGGRRNLLQLRRKHLERFADRMDMDGNQIIRRFATLVRLLPDAFESAVQSNHDTIALIGAQQFIEDYRKRITMTYDDAASWLDW